MLKALVPAAIFICTLASFQAAAAEPLDDIVSANEPWRLAVDGIDFPDGLSGDAHGNLHFSDLNGKNAGVYRLSPDGAKSKLADGGQSGTRLGPDNKLYVVGGGKLSVFDLASRQQKMLASDISTNDLAVSSTGHIYLTETGKKQVTLVDAKTGKTAPADVGITAPNGIGLSPDHKTLYVSDYGGTKVWAFAVRADGTLADKKPLMTMDAPQNKPTVAAGDGLTVDEAERVYVTTATGLQVFDVQGKSLGTIANPDDGSSRSVAFAGKDRDMLYIACGKKIYVRKAKVRGAPVAGQSGGADEGPKAYREPYRPQFHFTPERNWMNDPNGLVYFDGEYHLFYQYNPEGNDWGHMSWGHAVSEDRLHWKHLPIALHEENGVMIFSGSAVVDEKNSSGFGKDGQPPLVAIYTGHGLGKQTQNIAYSHDKGRTWTKYDKNPVIDINSPEFRDPKVFWHEPTKRWIMVVAKSDDRKVFIYSSTDLKKWERRSEFGPQGGANGVWECPDLVELPIGEIGAQQSRWVLFVNVGGGGPTGGNGCQYYVGTFDGETFHNDNPKDLTLWADMGPDFYAAQSWSNLPKREPPTWIGWMTNGRYAGQQPTSPWRSAQSIPRHLALASTIEGLRLQQMPDSRLIDLRSESFKLENPAAVSATQNPLRDLKVAAETLELRLSFANINATEFGIRLKHSEEYETLVGFDARKQCVFVDRTHSGKKFHDAFPGRHEAPAGDACDMTIFVDRSSVEVFANDGTSVLTELIFPTGEGHTVEAYAKDGEAILREFAAWKLKSVWHEASQKAATE